MTAAALAYYRDAAAVRLDQLARDRQAQPAAPFTGRALEMRALELIEYVL
jgi:hypothetical protein